MNQKEKKVIIGIDPGLADIGYGIIETDGHTHRVIDFANLKTSSKLSLPERLHKIHTDLDKLLTQHSPQLAAVEELFFYNNAKTAIAVGQARGVILLTCMQRGTPIHEYTPLQVKQSVTGHGSADKKQVQKMVQLTLGLAELPTPDDAADGLALAIAASTAKISL